MKHALIVGVSGIIGNNIAKQLANEGDWKITGVARRKVDFLPQEVKLVTLDIANIRETREIIGSFANEVTHLFYVTWVQGYESEYALGKANEEIFDNILTTVTEVSNLKFVYLQTGTKYYGMHLGPESEKYSPWKETCPRLSSPNFYYNLEDLLVDKARNQNWKWATVRPCCILGISFGKAMNLGFSLAVYATVLKELGKPLIFPYGQKAFESLREIADARLVTKFAIWLTKNDHCSSEAFNITNGEPFRYRFMWEKIANYFYMEIEVVEGGESISNFMADKKDLWRSIVDKHHLRPLDLDLLGTWDFMDLMLSRKFDEFSSTQKMKKFGFNETFENDESFFDLFDTLKNAKIIPAYEDFSGIGK